MNNLKLHSNHTFTTTLLLEDDDNTPSEYYELHTLQDIISVHTIITELSLLPNKPSVIAVSETWAHTDNDSLPISGYTCIQKARKNKPGGGVALYTFRDYCHNDIKYVSFAAVVQELYNTRPRLRS